MKPDQGSNHREESEGPPYGFRLDALDEGRGFRNPIESRALPRLPLRVQVAIIASRLSKKDTIRSPFRITAVKCRPR